MTTQKNSAQNLSNYTEDYYRRDIAETWFWENKLLRPDQLAAICYAHGWPFMGNEELVRRNPGHIYSIGCGRGELELALQKMGHRVTGVDPSPGAKIMYEGQDLVKKYQGGGDTIIFCESLEHIPLDEIWHIWSLIPDGARIIITNWITNHPIPPSVDGWDHITLVDDILFDRLSDYHHVIVRNGSHLVLDKPNKPLE